MVMVLYDINMNMKTLETWKELCFTLLFQKHLLLFYYLSNGLLSAQMENAVNKNDPWCPFNYSLATS